MTQGIDCLRTVPMKDQKSTFPPPAAFPAQGLNCLKRQNSLCPPAAPPRLYKAHALTALMLLSLTVPAERIFPRSGNSASSALQSASPPSSAALQGVEGAAITLQLVLNQHCSPEAPACRGMAPMTHEIEVSTP